MDKSILVVKLALKLKKSLAFNRKLCFKNQEKLHIWKSAQENILEVEKGT